MDTIRAEVLAVIVALVDGEPCVLVLDGPLRLPAGPLLPGHHSLQAATRAWVEAQTGRTLGYLEQLYTFIDVDRDSEAARRLSISYLGLTTDDDLPATRLGRWRRWYELFPWEDRRHPGPSPVAALAAGVWLAARVLRTGAVRPMTWLLALVAVQWAAVLMVVFASLVD